MPDSEVPDDPRADLRELLRQHRAVLDQLVERLEAPPLGSVSNKVETNDQVMPDGSISHRRIINDDAGALSEVSSTLTIMWAVGASVEPETVNRVARWLETAGGFVGGAILSGPLGEAGNWTWEQITEVVEKGVQHAQTLGWL